MSNTFTLHKNDKSLTRAGNALARVKTHAGNGVDVVTQALAGDSTAKALALQDALVKIAGDAKAGNCRGAMAYVIRVANTALVKDEPVELPEAGKSGLKAWAGLGRRLQRGYTAARDKAETRLWAKAKRGELETVAERQARGDATEAKLIAELAEADAMKGAWFKGLETWAMLNALINPASEAEATEASEAEAEASA